MCIQNVLSSNKSCPFLIHYHFYIDYFSMWNRILAVLLSTIQFLTFKVKAWKRSSDDSTFFLHLAKQRHLKLVTCSSQMAKHYGKNSSNLQESLFFLYSLCCYPGLITNFQKILTATLTPKLDIGENKLNILKHVIT